MYVCRWATARASPENSSQHDVSGSVVERLGLVDDSSSQEGSVPSETRTGGVKLVEKTTDFLYSLVYEMYIIHILFSSPSQVGLTYRAAQIRTSLVITET